MMRIIVKGDKSRYQFFRRIIAQGQLGSDFSIENLSKRCMRVTSNKCVEEDDCYYSAYIPLHTEMVFPDEFGISSYTCDSGDKILLFDEFPYRTGEELERQRQDLIENEQVHCEVVLVKNERKALNSDISSEDTALEEAYREYEEEQFSVKVFKMDSICTFLFWTQERNNSDLDGQWHRKLSEIKYKIEEEMDFDYELAYMCGISGVEGISSILENPAVLDRFIKYNPNICGKNVIDQYCDNAYEFFWVDNANLFWGMASGIYKKYMIDICIWDIEKDLNNLRELLENSFKDYVAAKEKLVFNESKDAYSEFVHQNANALLSFKARIQEFFRNRMRDIIKAQMLKHIQKLEEILDEKIY